MINEVGFNNAFYYFRYDRGKRWAIVRERMFVYGTLFKQWRNDRFFENGVKLIADHYELNTNYICLNIHHSSYCLCFDMTKGDPHSVIFMLMTEI